MTTPALRKILLAAPSWPEASAVRAALRTETVGGALLLGAALLAVLWVNRRGTRAMSPFVT